MSALTHSPAAIIQQLLIDLGLGTDVDDDDDWPISRGREPDSPDSVITIYDTTSVKDGRAMVSGEVFEHRGFQVRVRDADHDDGWEKADAIAEAMDESVNLTDVSLSDNVGTGTSTYKVYAISRTSGPIDIGKEPESKRNIFTINAIVAIRQTA